MKKTCLLFVSGVLFASALYFFLIRKFIPEIPAVPSVGIAILGGVSLLALFGAISTYIQRISDKAVIASAVKGIRFSDGKRTAAIGRLEATGLATIAAPFSGRDCLAYEYEIYELVTVRVGKGPARTEKQLYCSGYGMIPSQVRTNQGDIRLLGFPILDEFKKDFTESDEDRERATSYMTRTKFHNLKQDFKNVFSEFDDLFQDADGSVRKDLGEPVNLDLKHHLTEIIVPRGAEVCAIGVYSKKDQALIAKTSALPIRLAPGNAKEAGKRFGKAGSLGFALLFFLAINGLLSFLYFSFQKDRYKVPESEQSELIHQLADSHDFEKLAKALQSGLNPDATDSESRTLLQTTKEDEVARLLLQSGANPNVEDPGTLETPIFYAAREGNLSRLKILLEGGANVNAVSAIPWKHTAIDEALRTGKSDSVELLIKHGAKDPRVTAANGQPLETNGGEEISLCKKYLRAIQNQDKETLKSITTQRYDYFFDDIDFQAWKSAYPISIETFDGYSNDSASTISMRGKRSDGRDTEWIYQLVKETGGWKIHQTWPLTGEGYETIWR